MKTILFFCYYFLTLLFFPIFLIFVIIHILFKPRYLRPYLQRFSIVLPEKTPKTRKRVWLHAVSVGEVISCAPLIRLFQEKGVSVYLSTTTPTGFCTAQKQSTGIQLLYFPIDYSFVIRRLLNRIDPDAVLLCEMEIWPAFIDAVKKRRIPLYLISGRFGGTDFRNYHLLRFFFKHVLSLFDGLFMQSDLDTGRMKKLCNHKNIKALGSLKFDVTPDPVNHKVSTLLPDGSLLCAASTHRGDENFIVQAYKKLSEKYRDLKLLIVPRHAHRVGEITRILSKHGLDYTLRSNGTKCTTQVFLLDTVGELMGVFPKCHIVIMGGSFSKKIGGHNIIEPCLYKKCVLCGGHMENFRDIFYMLKTENAVVATNRENLFDDLDTLLQNRGRAELIGANAFRLIEKNRGASRRIYSEISH